MSDYMDYESYQAEAEFRKQMDRVMMYGNNDWRGLTTENHLGALYRKENRTPEELEQQLKEMKL